MAAFAGYTSRGCRPLSFSVAATHQALISILLKLEAARWKGSLYLVCNEKGWALATHLRKRFAALTIYIIDDRIAVADAAYLLAKEPRRLRSWTAV